MRSAHHVDMCSDTVLGLEPLEGGLKQVMVLVESCLDFAVLALD